MIYNQILEEISQGCNQHHEIADLEEELDAASSKNERIQQNLLNQKEDLKQVERDITVQMLKNLEFRKDADRIKLMNESDSPFELTQEDINKCIQKEDSSSLTDILSGMLIKLQNVKKQKTAELQVKAQEAQSAH